MGDAPAGVRSGAAGGGGGDDEDRVVPGDGAEDAGRDPDDVKVSVLCGLELDDDAAAAREAVRWAAAACANHIGDTMKRNPEHGMPETMTRLVEARTQHYDYYEGHLDSDADHTAYLTPELIDDFAIAGSADHCLEKIRALEELGVWEISSAYYNGRNDQLARVGREAARPGGGLEETVVVSGGANDTTAPRPGLLHARAVCQNIRS